MRHVKEPVNAFTHLSGAVIAAIGTVFLIIPAAMVPSVWAIIGFSVFGLSMILLYTSSGLYHMLNVTERWERRLKKLDHSMIFILIAGTYTPICLIPLRGAWGWSLFGVIWGFAIGGVLLKIFWIDAPRWLSTVIYLVMGWLCIIALYPMLRTFTHTAFCWLVAGGIFYTIGGIIYGRKKCLLRLPHLGFHEVFHIFVMLGTTCHYTMMIYLLS